MSRSTNRQMKFEDLEDRRLMAASIDLDNDNIRIEGTDDDDTIEISYNFQSHEVLVSIRDIDGNVIES